MTLKRDANRLACDAAEVLAARLAAAGAIFEDSTPAVRPPGGGEGGQQQQRTMRQGGSKHRTQSDEDSDFD